MMRFLAAPIFALALASAAHAQSGLLPANQVWAGPASGGQGYARARALVTADLPALSFGSFSLASGQIAVGQVSGFAGAVAMSGDCTIVASGAITCTKLNGTTPGTGVLAALGIATGSAGSVVVNGGPLGTPSSGSGANLTALNATNISTGTLAPARGGIDLTAWSAFTPALTCGTATFTTTSARSKTMGKTTFIELDFTIATLGTCNNAVTLTLPNTPQSGGAFVMTNIAITGACSILPSNATATCAKFSAAAFAAAEHYTASGSYENQ